MVEPARRHGHFDPRFAVAAAPARARRKLRLVVASGQNGGLSRWEDEGGRTSVELDVPAAQQRPSPGLEWYGFLAAMFPQSRRHDGEALKGYEAYALSVAAR